MAHGISKTKILLLSAFIGVVGGCSRAPDELPKRVESQNSKDYSQLKVLQRQFEAMSGKFAGMGNQDWDATDPIDKPDFKSNSTSIITQMKELESTQAQPLLKAYDDFKKRHGPNLYCDKLLAVLDRNPEPSIQELNSLMEPKPFKDSQNVYAELSTALAAAENRFENSFLNNNDRVNKEVIVSLETRINALPGQFTQWNQDMVPARKELKVIHDKLQLKRDEMRAYIMYCKGNMEPQSP